MIPPNYTTFRVTSQGRLVPVPDSTISVVPGSVPSQAAISSLSPLVFEADFFGGVLQSFRLPPNGRLNRGTPLLFASEDCPMR